MASLTFKFSFFLKTILLADDDEDFRFLAQRAFSRLALDGAQVLMVPDGAVAVEYLAGKGIYADRAKYPVPDVMLLDIKMPLKTGFDVLAAARSLPDLPRIVVVMLSSSGEPTDVRKAYEMGANSYLHKPITTNDLHRLLEGVKLYWLELNRLPVDL